MRHGPSHESENHKNLIRTAEIGGAALFFAALVIVKHRETAEDVVQDAYLKAFRHLDSFKGDSRISTWLYRITINTAKDRVAKDSHMPLPAFDDVVFEDLE